MMMYWGDYLQDTAHLNVAQHGAYLLLIAHYWSHGSLPGDDKQMAAITRQSVNDWRQMKAVIASFFYKDWKHKRVEFEWQKAKGKIEKRTELGAAGGIKSGEVRRAKAEQRRLAEIQEYIKTNKLDANQLLHSPEPIASIDQSKNEAKASIERSKHEANANQPDKKERIERSTPPVDNVDNVDNSTVLPANEFKPLAGSLATALPSGALARRVETAPSAELLPENKFEPRPGKLFDQSGITSSPDSNFRVLSQDEADKLSDQLLQNPWLRGPIQ